MRAKAMATADRGTQPGDPTTILYFFVDPWGMSCHEEAFKLLGRGKFTFLNEDDLVTRREG